MSVKFKQINVVAFKVGENPQEITLENELKAMQKFVNGYIQIVPLLDTGLELVCNEEGMYQEELQEQYRMFGNFFITRGKDLGNEDEGIEFVPLTTDEVEFIKHNIQLLLKGVNRI